MVRQLVINVVLTFTRLCLACKKRHQATKKFDLWKLPKILVIHLKRFKYTNQCRSKIATFIDFPHKNLDLSEYIKHNNYSEPVNPPPIYDLFAVSCHSGNLGGGHYIAYCLNSTTQKWYCFNDSVVTSCDPQAARTSGAYLLFYQRRDTQIGNMNGGATSTVAHPPPPAPPAPPAPPKNSYASNNYTNGGNNSDNDDFYDDDPDDDSDNASYDSDSVD